MRRWIPPNGLIQAANGNLYGTTALGGTGLSGTVFEISTSGKLSTLYTFCSAPNCADGIDPNALIQAADSNFYGTTFNGGTHDQGTVFKITPAGKLTTLYSFCSVGTFCTDGANPYAALVQGNDGDFYGTKLLGGNEFAGGVVFKITPGGNFSVLYDFCTLSNCADGSYPSAPLIQASDGNFYGTAYNGGGCFGRAAMCSGSRHPVY